VARTYTGSIRRKNSGCLLATRDAVAAMNSR
jgi:hypothetical protein